MKEHTEGRFHSLIQNSEDIIAILDKDGKILYESLSFEKILGYQMKDAIGLSVFNFVYEDDAAEAHKIFIEVLNTQDQKPMKTKLRLIHADGHWSYFEVVLTNLLKEPSVNGIVLNYRDISEQKEAQKEIERWTYYDYLTDLPNRRLFQKKLDLEITLAKQNKSLFALLLLDLDRFKYINDTLGHDCGDKLLVQVAKRLNSFAYNGIQAFRLGGDEFAIIIPSIVIKEDATTVTKKVLELLEEPFKLDNYEIFVTGSIGVSIYPENGVDTKTLMKSADIAMYRAKDKGKNNFELHTSTMDDESSKRFSLENDLRKALKEEQFEVYYQPRVDCTTNTIIGAEALLRWNHPDWGIVYPNEFISLAEETAMMVAIGEWVFKKVCQHIKLWQKEELPAIKTSINSSIPFLKLDLVSSMKNIIEENQVNPTCIEIELNANMLFDSEEGILKTINDFKELGMKVALDDFGIGYSSLSILKKFNIDRLKVGKLFLKEISDKDGAEVLSTIIRIAQGLNINTVVEGVGTQEQLKFLRNINCVEVQGEIYSRAIKRTDFQDMLKKGKCYPVGKKSEEIQVNERNFFRINLFYPLSADMTIIQVKGKKVELGNSDVLIQDIGPGGLRFITNIKFPVRPELLLSFTTVLFKQTVEVKGNIVWSNEIESNLYLYGFEFYMTEREKGNLNSLLNKLQVQLRKTPILPDCSFVTTSKVSYFNKE